MKQFQDETDALATTADAVIQASWRVIRIVRAAIERGQTTDLTMTQLHALAFLASAPGASLSEVAAHLGLRMPTTSKVVEGLVQQGRVARKSVPGNRRKLALHVTAAGRRVMSAAARPGVTSMAELLAQLGSEERRTVERTMSLLQPIVLPAVGEDVATIKQTARRATSSGAAQRTSRSVVRAGATR